MGDDLHQEEQVHCNLHPRVEPTHSSSGEPDVCQHDRHEESDDQDMDLEEELKSTRDGYEEEITVPLEENEDLKKKLGIFMGDPAPEEDNHPEDYIIIDDTISDLNSDDNYEDEAGADIMESSTDQNF